MPTAISPIEAIVDTLLVVASFRPGRYYTAYEFFSLTERARLKSENPTLSVVEVAKELGRLWAALDPKIKAKYLVVADRVNALNVPPTAEAK